MRRSYQRWRRGIDALEARFQGLAAGVAALIKRWLLGTHHGTVQPKHLDAYLDGFVFRLNRRKSAFRNRALSSAYILGL